MKPRVDCFIVCVCVCVCVTKSWNGVVRRGIVVPAGNAKRELDSGLQWLRLYAVRDS